MDNSEEPPLCRFGTPLEPLEEDDVPSKKPVAIEDQIVTDENGRRRFHGAFTGGFSAGFWNTVGSLEGWKPQSFKSSRSEKAEKRQLQLPTDFMDDEDLGEFGIAPQRVQAKEDFAKKDESSNLKRKFANSDSGPIPGISVLHQLLEPSREKVAIRLLRRMGWKPGQGIGARQTKKEKARSKERNNRELYVMKMYGCSMAPSGKPSEGDSEEGSEASEEDEEVTFAPDDFEPFICTIKDNTFGLGYSGLSRNLAGEPETHINLFGPLEVMGKSNKKLSIRGQAFGVGALEEEDEDIYARDDMSKYDFSLGDKKRNKQKLASVQDQTVLEGFAEPTNISDVQKTVHRIELKSNFKPRNWSQRKTRFEPLSEEKIVEENKNDAYKKIGLGRHDLDPSERGSILDGQVGKSVEVKKGQEAVSKKQSYLQHISQKYREKESKSEKILELLSSKADNFVKAGQLLTPGLEVDQSSQIKISEDVTRENQKILAGAKEITKCLGSSSGAFKPFANNEAKQERYEKFIEANLKQEDEIKAFLTTIQPVHLSEWDREMERKEFVQARNIYKPLNGLMSERFVSKSNVSAPEVSKTEHGEKVIVCVERAKGLWKPCALLCKRFNIPEPFGGALVEPKVVKKNKFSVFDYIENSINSKKDFVTPVIIPKHIERPKELLVQTKTLESPKKLLPTDESMLPSTSKTSSSQIRETFAKERKEHRTELELKIEESKNKHPSEKKDLFKCIFDSSSDEETQHDDAKGDKNSENTPEPVISAEIVRDLVKPSAPINILRNNSPARGIFAALFSKPESKEKETKEVTTDESDQIDDTYGPKVPTNFVTQSSTRTTLNADNIDKKIIQFLSTKPAKVTKAVEEWVEKTNKSSKKRDKKKKKKHDRKEKEKVKQKKSKKHRSKNKGKE